MTSQDCFHRKDRRDTTNPGPGRNTLVAPHDPGTTSPSEQAPDTPPRPQGLSLQPVAVMEPDRAKGPLETVVTPGRGISQFVDSGPVLTDRSESPRLLFSFFSTQNKTFRVFWLFVYFTSTIKWN